MLLIMKILKQVCVAFSSASSSARQSRPPPRAAELPPLRAAEPTPAARERAVPCRARGAVPRRARQSRSPPRAAELARGRAVPRSARQSRPLPCAGEPTGERAGARASERKGEQGGVRWGQSARRADVDQLSQKGGGTRCSCGTLGEGERARARARRRVAGQRVDGFPGRGASGRVGGHSGVRTAVDQHKSQKNQFVLHNVLNDLE